MKVRNRDISFAEVTTCRVQRADGVYIYEQVTGIDTANGKKVRVRSRLLGREDPVTGNVLPEDKAGKARLSAVDIVGWAARMTGIDRDLMAIFGPDSAAVLATFSRYLALTSGAPLSRIEGWMLTHDTPWEGEVDLDGLHDFCSGLGRRDRERRRLFADRLSRYEDERLLALDCSPVQGAVGRPLTVCSIVDVVPAALALQPEGLDAVAAMRKTLKGLPGADLKRTICVTARGLREPGLVDALQQSGLPFLTAVDSRCPLAARAAAALRRELAGDEAVCPMDPAVRGAVHVTGEGPGALRVHVFQGRTLPGGSLVLAGSGDVTNPWAAMKHWRALRLVEAGLHAQDNPWDHADPRALEREHVMGRLTIAFVALCLQCFLDGRLENVRAGIAERSAKGQKVTDAEAELARWLAPRALCHVLDRFDCPSDKRLLTASGAARWSARGVRQDRALLRLMGVTS